MFINLFKDQKGGPARKDKKRDIQKFMAFVRHHLCCVPGCTRAAEFHHLVYKSKGNSCSDILGLPLCSGHHTNNPDSIHSLGMEAFEIHWGIEAHRIVIGLLEEWVINSTYNG